MFENILKILPPPKKPIYNNGDWVAVEKQFNIKFPKDYKKVIENYGSGTFSGFFQFISPFSNENKEYETYVIDRLDDYEPENIDELPKYPENGGIYPFASFVGGDTLYWITIGPPDKWKIYVMDHRSDEANILNMGCEVFLVRWYKNKLKNCYSSNKSLRPYFTPDYNFKNVNVYVNFIHTPFLKRFEALSKKMNIIEKRHESNLDNLSSHPQISFLTKDGTTEISYFDNLKYGSSISVKFLEENENDLKKQLKQSLEELNWEVRQIINNNGKEEWSEFNCIKTDFYKKINELDRFSFTSNPVYKIKENSGDAKEILVSVADEDDVKNGCSLIVHADFHDKHFGMHTGYIFYRDSNDYSALNPHLFYRDKWHPLYLHDGITDAKIRMLKPILNEIFPIKFVSIEAFGLKEISGVFNSFCYIDKKTGKIKEVDYDFKPPTSSIYPDWIQKKMDEM